MVVWPVFLRSSSACDLNDVLKNKARLVFLGRCYKSLVFLGFICVICMAGFSSASLEFMLAAVARARPQLSFLLSLIILHTVEGFPNAKSAFHASIKIASFF